MSSIRRAAAGLGVILLTGLAACSSSPSSPSSKGGSVSDKAPFTISDKPVATHQVDLPKSYKFAPRAIEVKAGTTVTWTNHDDFPHNVLLLTGPDRSSNDLAVGKSVSIRFDTPGTVYYRCNIHPAQMQGKVVVT